MEKVYKEMSLKSIMRFLAIFSMIGFFVNLGLLLYLIPKIKKTRYHPPFIFALACVVAWNASEMILRISHPPYALLLVRSAYVFAAFSAMFLLHFVERFFDRELPISFYAIPGLLSVFVLFTKTMVVSIKHIAYGYVMEFGPLIWIYLEYVILVNAYSLYLIYKLESSLVKKINKQRILLIFSGVALFVSIITITAFLPLLGIASTPLTGIASTLMGMFFMYAFSLKEG
ncbi:MAG: hypothetical protein J7K68_05095 [Candidatus Diapherotrites archaeon]|nr:hypothetical protein [Candidatus Diapherotrites archaeon]